MDGSTRSGGNTVLYVVGGAGLLVVLAGCCVVAAALGFFVTARSEAPEVRERDPVARVPTPAPARGAGPSGGSALGPAFGAANPPLVTLGLVPTPTSDRRWRHIEATVTRARGPIGVSEGDTCSFDVQVLDRSSEPGHICRTFAQCSGVRLFGEDFPRRTGFFPCQLYDSPFGVAGEDLEPTQSADAGDPMFQIDTRSMTFTAADDEHGRLGAAFLVVARIDSVTPR
ncbi:MAG: hypothetical protein KF729_33705 [Sandaracinaceae bacterium]|nr:hypothetical protein [Sandaracinaceae bacterium]